MPGKAKDPTQAFLLNKFLHFYDQVNDGEIDSAKVMFDNPFVDKPEPTPLDKNAKAKDLVAKKAKNKASLEINPEMKIKLSNSYLDGYITKLHRTKYKDTHKLSLMKI